MARFGIALLILVTLPASTAGAVEQIALDYQSELRIDGQITGRLENAGDFDDDGIDDLLVLGSDRAYVVYGAQGYDYLDLSDPSTRVSKVLTQGLVDAASLGDVNGDGMGDIGVVSPDEAWVIFGGHGRANVQTPVPPSRGYKLTLVAKGYDPRIFGVGDLNSDGLAEIAVGEPSVDQPNTRTGRVTIVFGSASSAPVDLSAPGARGFRILGPGEYAELGLGVAGPGDLNGDGHNDLVVSAGNFMIDDALIYAITLDGTGTDIDLADGFNGFRIVHDPDAGPQLPELVAGAGDVDRDGLADILLPIEGSVDNSVFGFLVVRGSTSDETVTVRYVPDARAMRIYPPPRSPEQNFGTAAAGSLGRDWNGDGTPDLVLGFTGGAYVVGGPYEGPSFTVDDAGPIARAGFGRFPSVEATSIDRVVDGDFNGDGKLDLALSAPVPGFFSGYEVGSIYVAAGGIPRPAPGVCVERQKGSEGADVLKGTNAGDLLDAGAGPDELRGLSGADCLAAGADDDVLLGEPGLDFLFAGFGDDLLEGGAAVDYLVGDAGDDALHGGDGNDMLEPGAGADSVDGGPGNDLLDARDGQPDRIDCGPPVPEGAGDFAYTDPMDTVVGACSPYGPHIQLSDRQSEFLFSPYAPHSFSTGMAYDRIRDRFLVAWAEFTPDDGSYSPPGEGRIVVRAVDGRGFALGQPHQVSADIPVKAEQGRALRGRIAVAAVPDGRGFVVSWNEPRLDGRMLATSRVVRPNGAPYPEPPSVYGSGERDGTTIDVVAARRDDHLLAMVDTPGSHGSIRVLGPDGSVVGPAHRLRGPRRVSGSPALAADGRGFLLAWTGRAEDAPFARRLDSTGRPAGPVRRLGTGQRCCTGGGAMALAYDPDKRRYLAAWEAQNGVRTVLVRRGGRPIRRPRVYDGSHTLEISEPAVAHGNGRFLLTFRELETSGDRYYPNPHVRTHAFWLNARGRRIGASRPYAGPDVSMGASVGYSASEGRFTIASLASGDPFEEEDLHFFSPLRIFARTWPGAPLE